MLLSQINSLLPNSAAPEQANDVEDRREYLKTLAINEQWKVISLQPRIMRIWHTIACAASGLLVLVVYVFGWRRHGASWLMVVPPCVYAATAFTTMISYNINGILSLMNHFGPFQALIQMYYMVFPLFQPVSQVRNMMDATSMIAFICWSKYTSANMLDGLCRSRSDAHSFICLQSVWTHS